MSKFTKILLAMVLSVVFAVAVGFSIVYYGLEGQNFNATLSNQYLWFISGGILLALIIFVLLKWADGKELFKDGGKKKGKNTDKPTDQYFDGRWLTQQEMDKKYCGCDFNDLHKIESGIPLRAQIVGSHLRINLLQQAWQTIIIGTTGSGKTSAIIIPTIQILSSTQTKPSLVISDPKGELYSKDYLKLKQEGYEIRVFDLRNPFSSTRWNPMERAYNFFQRALNLRKEVKVHHGDNPADTPGLKIISDTYNNEWFEFDGVALPTRESIELELKAKTQQLTNAAHEDLDDLATVICPDNPGDNDPQWTRGARDFIKAVMLAMLEDSADPRFGLTLDKFNLFNVYNICTLRDQGKNPYESLQNYFNGRGKLSQALKKAGPIINNAKDTTGGYLGIVGQCLSAFADDGLCYATSADELKFSDIADKPTALFIKTPDEKVNKHFMVTMLVTQLYKALVEKASIYSPTEQKLPRPVYMILDEFGNLPKFPNLDQIITVGRGRKIIMIMAVQDYGQLNKIYGDQVAKIVRGNCNVHIYLGTQEQETKEEFSKRCGQTVVEVENTSESKGKGKDSTSSKTISKSQASRALITPDELGLLKMGEMIVSVYGDRPMRTNFTQYFDAKNFYNCNLYQDPYTPSKYLDKEKIFYDIKKRNDIVYRNELDDSDFDF